MSQKMYLLSIIDCNVDSYKNYTHPVFNELKVSIHPNDLNKIEVSDNDDIFLTMIESKVFDIVNIFEKYFKVIKEDITENIINGMVYPNVEYDIFERFRIDYTTVDNILDKILINGINCLDNIDYMILESKKPPKLVAFNDFDVEFITA
jgi:hypothetical protein